MADAILKLSDAFSHIDPAMQMGKVSEEVGEAWGAYIGLLGTNPRKGRTHLISDVRAELLDVALTALMAYRNVGGGTLPLADLERHIEARWQRHLREVPRGSE